MTMNISAPKTLNKNQFVYMRVTLFSILIGCVLATSMANAASKIAIGQPTTGNTTVVEQHSNGKNATITAMPNGITMQDGLPFSVAQISNVPRYTIHQGTTQGSTTITTVPVDTLPLNTIPVTKQVTQAGVLTTPVNTVAQVLPVATSNEMPVLNQTTSAQPTINQTVTSQAVTNQVVSIATSLDTLQLQPTFSTPDIVGAQTKIMKILKNSEGRDMAVPANHVAPGDVIEYHTTYINTTAQPVSDINAKVSLPSGVKLVSLNSSLPTFATTGGDNYQTIKQVGNTVVVQENYSGLKWNLVNLDANTPQTVIIRAKVQ
ncbi:hypothetical protein ACS8FB_03415 [Psychrobacter sp. 1U1]|uniref:hypothetical protein n=1 Tax=Psychrobacter sp. 1U1 TaxID=3453576 RepID=UPI003F460379